VKKTEGKKETVEKKTEDVLDKKNEKNKKADGAGKKDAKDDTEKVIKTIKKKKVRRQVQRGRAYIKSTYNNTIVSLTDLHGNLLAWSSAGILGFKGAKKATTFAAAQIVNDVTEKAEKFGLKDLEVYVKGIGSGREAAIRALIQKGFNLNLIKDKTPIPHNGCRSRKPRRV
jgi:small subunit ribosomal protein S11